MGFTSTPTPDAKRILPNEWPSAQAAAPRSSMTTGIPCPLCLIPCANDERLLKHLRAHSYSISELLQLIKFLHVHYDPKKDKYTAWDMKKGKPPPTWWIEASHLRMQGWTLQEIGDKYHLTRERIRQVLALLRRQQQK